MSTVTITLTPEQRKQIKDATGQDVSEFRIGLATKGELSDGNSDKSRGDHSTPI